MMELYWMVSWMKSWSNRLWISWQSPKFPGGAGDTDYFYWDQCIVLTVKPKYDDWLFKTWTRWVNAGKHGQLQNNSMTSYGFNGNRLSWSHKY